MDLPVHVHTNSIAAKGIAKHVGLGTQRHVAINTLWVQEKLRKGAFVLHQIPGEDNPADLFTKHLTAEKMHKCLAFISAEYREGRPDAAPQRKGDEQIISDSGEWNYDDYFREEIS